LEDLIHLMILLSGISNWWIRIKKNIKHLLDTRSWVLADAFFID